MITLHVGQQGGHIDPADLLHQPLQGHRLAGARGAGDQQGLEGHRDGSMVGRSVEMVIGLFNGLD